MIEREIIISRNVVRGHILKVKKIPFQDQIKFMRLLPDKLYSFCRRCDFKIDFSEKVLSYGGERT